MSKYMCMLLILLLSGMATAQTLLVKEAGTGDPLVGVSVTSDRQEILLTTDGEGKVDVSRFSDANNVYISYIGYQTRKLSIDELKYRDYIIELNKVNVLLDQVVVAATRWGQRRRDVPSRISSISNEDVRLKNPQTSADLLGINGEVFIQKSQQGGGSPMIRGFSTNRLLYAVDGVRMNTAIFRSGNLQNVISIDPFSVERTEIVFGPGSVIYGSDAIGGVMSFQTLAPELSTDSDFAVSGTATARYSSANSERTGHFDFNLGWRKWAMRTSITSFQFDDLRMGRYGPDDYLRPFYVKRIDSTDLVIENEDPLLQKPTAYDQMNLMHKIRFVPDDRWSFDLSSIYSTTTDFPRYDRLILTDGNQPLNAEWNYGPQTWSLNALNVRYARSIALFDEVNLKLAYQRFEESRMDRRFMEVLRRITEEEVDAWSGNLDFRKPVGAHLHLFYGFETVMNDVASTGSIENIATGVMSNGPSRYPQSRWWSNAVYFTVQKEVTRRFGWQVGLRYNYFDLDADFSNNLPFYPFDKTTANLTHSAFSGNAGLLWKPDTRSTFSLNLSSGFRAPNVDDIGKIFDSEPGSVVVPNSDLRSEQAYNAELGWTQRLKDWFRVDASIYYTLLENAMVRRNFELNGRDSILFDGELSQVQAIQNAALARVYGGQISVEVKFAGNWSWLTRLNYQKGEEELDDGTTSPSRHAAPMFGKSQIRFRDERFSLDLDISYNAERSFDDMPVEEIGKEHLYARNENGQPYSPRWYTLNLHTSYQLTDELSIGAAIENITDQRYRPYSSGLAGSGRNFILSIRTRFDE